MNKLFIKFSTLTLIWVVVTLLALYFGAVQNLPIKELLDLRVPRVLLALAIGAGLATSGVALQALFANPLCEPYTLGIASGASLGYIVAELMHFSAGLGALVFSVLFALILFLISLKKQLFPTSLLLTGVMLSYLGMGVIAVWTSFVDPAHLQAALLWMLGDLTRNSLNEALLASFMILVLIFALWTKSKQLDALQMGWFQARAQGLETRNLQSWIILWSGMMVSICICYSGAIGFVGLVVPFFVRSLFGNLHRILIPAAVLLGGILLTSADLLSRVLVKPNEIPVGALTTLLGVPFFLWLYLKKNTQGNLR